MLMYITCTDPLILLKLLSLTQQFPITIITFDAAQSMSIRKVSPQIVVERFLKVCIMSVK